MFVSDLRQVGGFLRVLRFPTEETLYDNMVKTNKVGFWFLVF